MLSLMLFLACILTALGTGVLAGWSDLKGLVIPNIYSAIVGTSFLTCFVLLWLLDSAFVFGPFTAHLLAALLVFGLTAALFALKAIGAADSKLATVFALWVGLKGLPAFLFYMTVFGGLLALFALYVKRCKPFPAMPPQSWIGQVQAGASKVPYGVAIVLGAAGAFLFLGYASPAVWQNFLG